MNLRQLVPPPVKAAQRRALEQLRYVFYAYQLRLWKRSDSDSQEQPTVWTCTVGEVLLGPATAKDGLRRSVAEAVALMCSRQLQETHAGCDDAQQPQHAVGPLPDPGQQPWDTAAVQQGLPELPASAALLSGPSAARAEAMARHDAPLEPRHHQLHQPVARAAEQGTAQHVTLRAPSGGAGQAGDQPQGCAQQETTADCVVRNPCSCTCVQHNDPQPLLCAAVWS